MNNAKCLDLSYNLLGSLGCLSAFPNLRELNLRANNLVSLVNMRVGSFTRGRSSYLKMASLRKTFVGRQLCLLGKFSVSQTVLEIIEENDSDAL